MLFFLTLGSREPVSISKVPLLAPRRTSLFRLWEQRYVISCHTHKSPEFFAFSTGKPTHSLLSWPPPLLVASSVFVSQGPLKQVSKFAEQLSGAVNQKVMELGDAAPSPDIEAATLEGAEAAAAATAAAVGGAAGIGMAQGWKPPTTELGMDEELANDVPGELSIDEQVGFLQRHGRYRSTRFPK